MLRVLVVVVRLEEEDRLEDAVRFPPVLFFFAVAMVSDPFRVGFPPSGGGQRKVLYSTTVFTMPAMRLPRPITQQ